jgi:phosphoheptose isomerase
LTEDNGFVPLRKDKTKDGGNEIVKVCSKRTKITKEHKIVIIGNTHSTVCAMRVQNYLNNKFEVNGLVKPRTGVYIVLNSTIKDIVNLTKSDVIVFVVV